MPTKFNKGQTYTRGEVADAIDLPSGRRVGNWATGYASWQGEFFVFCNVGVAGRTGHDYPNKWEGSELTWFGKGPSHRSQPQIKKMTSGESPVHVFWRSSDRSPFTYAGIGKAAAISASTPVKVKWTFN